MSESSRMTSLEPDGAPRIAILDILRGIAILGILFMNINDMGQSIKASFNDIRHLGWSQSDQIAWWMRKVLASGTARGLLEMLFGAGMVILTERAARTVDAWGVMRRYYGRNLILFAFGLVHVFILLWPGDILHTYGMAALVAFWFRRLRVRWLLTLGVSLALIQLIFGGYFGYYTTLHDRARITAIEARVATGTPPTPEERTLLKENAEAAKKQARRTAELRAEIAAEDKARTGTFASWARAQWGVFLEMQSQFLEILFVWEAVSVMLLGAALYKLGILQGRRSRRFYARTVVIAYAVGLMLRVIAAYEQSRFGDGPSISWFTSEMAREILTLGHVALINLLVMSATGAALLRPFAAAGRTALSIYIAQTLICMWVLYPPFMLGLYGRMTWAPLMLTALAINAALLVGANIWVRYFDVAPVEWAWRSLVEGRGLPWRKGSPRDPHTPLLGYAVPR